MSNKDTPEKTVIAQNRKARHEYAIEEVYEAGIMLKGSEVKSLRTGKVNISDAYADEKNGEIWLNGAYISEYKGANQFNHFPTRPRKLLMRKSEIQKMFGKLKVKGYTLVPMCLYFNKKNIAKIELGLGKGKKLYDKRQDQKDKDWQRNKERIMKEQ